VLGWSLSRKKHRTNDPEKGIQKCLKRMQNQGYWVSTYYYRDVSQISGIVMKKMWALDLICADVNVQNLEAETPHGNPWEP